MQVQKLPKINRCRAVQQAALRFTMLNDTRQPKTMLWTDGMSAAQARKSLFGSNPALSSGGGNSLGLGGKSAISKYMKLANPGMFH